jgi:hypothetical protein
MGQPGLFPAMVGALIPADRPVSPRAIATYRRCHHFTGHREGDIVYPQVVQFETRQQQFELESLLIRERKQARANRTGERPSLLTRVCSALAGRDLRGTTATSGR